MALVILLVAVVALVLVSEGSQHTHKKEAALRSR